MTGSPRFTFLICSERSGSNLITSIMNGHPAISAPPPSHLFRLFVLNAENYGDLQRDANWETLLDDVYMAFAAQLGEWNVVPTRQELGAMTLRRSALAPVAALYEIEARRKGAAHVFVKENHTARFAEALRAELPDCRFVHMVRDPRDVAASYFATEGIPGGVARAVEVWIADQEETLRFSSRNSEAIVHALKYEDLLQDPRGHLNALTAFLGLPFDAGMLEYHSNPLVQRNAKRVDAWENLARPLMAGNRGKYLGVLTREETEYVELCCHTLMQHFGYSTNVLASAPDAASLPTLCEALKDKLRPGNYRTRTESEHAVRDRRLAVIDLVKSRRLT